MKLNDIELLIKEISKTDVPQNVKNIAIRALAKKHDTIVANIAKQEKSEKYWREFYDRLKRNEMLWEKHNAGEITYEDIMDEYGVSITTVINWLERGDPKHKQYNWRGYKEKAERFGWEE